MSARSKHRLTAPRARLILAAAITALTPLSSLAAVNTWLPLAGGTWSDSANWSDALPTPDDDVANHHSSSAITLTTAATVNSFVSDSSDLTITAGGRLNGTLPTSTAQINGLLTINNGGLANLTLLPGTGPTATYSGHGGNFLDAVSINADLSFPATAYARLYNASTLSANLLMSGTSNGIQFHDSSSKLTVTPSGAIKGYGALYSLFGGSTLDNHGLISADTAATTLSVAIANITSDGTLEAKNGGTLTFTGNSLLSGTGAGFTVHAATGAVTLNNAGLSGSYAASTGTGLSFSGHGGNYIAAAAMSGTLTFDADAYARIYNTSTLSGTLNFSGTSNGLQFHDSSSLLTVSPSGVIRGYGATYNLFGGSSLQNNGLVSADTAGQTLRLGQSNTTGSGTFEAKNGGTLILTTRLVATAASVVADTGTVLVDNGTIAGSISSATGSGISFSGHGGNALDTATINGNLTFSGPAYARVYNANSLTGTLFFSGTSNGLQFHDASSFLTLTPSGAIRGYGSTYNLFGGSTLTNNGLVSADAAGQTLRLGQTNTNGSGLFEGKNGGTLALTTRLVATGASVAATTGTVLVDNGTISGTISFTTGTGISFSGHGGNALDTANVNGTLTFAGAAYARVYNANILSGTLALSGTSNGLQFHNSDSSLTVTPAGSIRGYGSTYNLFGGATTTVNGTASADTPATTLTLGTSFLNGSGTFEAKNGGTLAITSDFTASSAAINTDADPTSTVLLLNGGLRGTVASSTGTGLSLGNHGSNFLDTATIAPAARLTLPQDGYARLRNANTIAGQLVLASTTNGLQLHNADASLLISPTGTARGYGRIYQLFGGSAVVNQGTLAADTAGQTLSIESATLTNSGAISVSPGATLAVSNSTTFTHLAGTIQVDGLLSYPSRTLSIPAGTLYGSGSLSLATFALTGGTVAPGDSTGTLSILGSYSQSSSSTLDIELAGTTQGITYDLLSVTGPASIGGTLNVSLAGGFTPNVGDSFTILTTSSRTGTFSSLASSTPGLSYTASYFPDHVTIFLTSVPEPTTLSLIALAPALLAPRRRKATGET